MIRILAFNGLLAACCSYALIRGGPPERVVGGALVAGYIATLASYSGATTGFYRVENGIFAVDLVLLAVLVTVALRADRAWPFLLSALQLDTVGAHLLKLADISVIRITYAVMIAAWSYPMLIALAVGTWRHRTRLNRDGYDLAWVPGPDAIRPVPDGR